MSKIPFIFHDLQDSQIFALAQAAGRSGYQVCGTLPNSKEAPWVNASTHVQHYYETPSLGDVNAGIYALNLKKSKLSGVFVPVVDDIADLLANYAPLLRKNGLRFLTPHPEHIQQINTINLQSWQGKLQIPRTAYCSGEELLQTAMDIGFPIILKSFRDGFITFANKTNMESWLDSQPDYPFHLHQRVQQYIEGETATMATAMLLFDEQSRPVRAFTARRMRVAQTKYGAFGETVAAQAAWLPDLLAAATELLSAIGWVGFAEVECKQDQNGAWHLIEINPRLSGWTCLAEADGAGFLQAYYHLNTEDKPLHPAYLQRSSTTYSRIIASSRHQPDWSNLSSQTYKSMYQHEKNKCYGAWDKLDSKANKAWLKPMLQRYLTKV